MLNHILTNIVDPRSVLASTEVLVPDARALIPNGNMNMNKLFRLLFICRPTRL